MAAARPDDFEELCVAHSDALYSASKSEAWRRPEKTQTKTQWEYISRVTRSILDIVGVDPKQAADSLRARFGSSGVDALLAVTGDGSRE